MRIKQEYFSTQGPYIMFVVKEQVEYHKFETITEMEKIAAKAKKTGYLDDHFQISWLNSYLKYRDNLSLPISSGDFIPHLRHFLKDCSQFENDILFNEDFTAILASRFYVESLRFQDSTIEGNMMLMMREIAENSTLPMLAYSPEFIYYEQYVSILKNTLLAVGVAIIGMLFVALMFIPHPISVTCITVTMVTIVLGMFGFMHFWGLALSAITTVQIILSVGFCVDFTVHISHAFMTATGKNRNERVMAALEKIGVPILNGAISSILGILMLAFTSSYIFKSFFKTMLLVIVLGLAHALLLLPVLLSFIGPRRTSKPRVFIPISNPSNRPAGDASKYKEKIEEQGRLRQDRAIAAAAAAAAAADVHATADSDPIHVDLESGLGEDGVEQIELVQMRPSVLDEEQILLLTPLDDDQQSSDNSSIKSDPLSATSHARSISSTRPTSPTSPISSTTPTSAIGSTTPTSAIDHTTPTIVIDPTSSTTPISVISLTSPTSSTSDADRDTTDIPQIILESPSDTSDTSRRGLHNSGFDRESIV